MPSTAIVTDTTSDVPPEEAKALSIEVVPVLITLNGHSYVDGLELSRADFYRRLPMTKAPATTAAPSLHAFEAVYEKVLSKGAARPEAAKPRASRSPSRRLSRFMSGGISPRRDSASSQGRCGGSSADPCRALLSSSCSRHTIPRPPPSRPARACGQEPAPRGLGAGRV